MTPKRAAAVARQLEPLIRRHTRCAPGSDLQRGYNTRMSAKQNDAAHAAGAASVVLHWLVEYQNVGDDSFFGSHWINEGQDFSFEATGPVVPASFGIQEICLVERWQGDEYSVTELWFGEEQIAYWNDRELIMPPCPWCPEFGTQTDVERKAIVKWLESTFPRLAECRGSGCRT